MNLARTPTSTLYGSVAYGGSISTPQIKAHLESMLGIDRTATGTFPHLEPSCIGRQQLSPQD